MPWLIATPHSRRDNAKLKPNKNREEGEEKKWGEIKMACASCFNGSSLLFLPPSLSLSLTFSPFGTFVTNESAILLSLRLHRLLGNRIRMSPHTHTYTGALITHHSSMTQKLPGLLVGQSSSCVCVYIVVLQSVTATLMKPKQMMMILFRSSISNPIWSVFMFCTFSIATKRVLPLHKSRRRKKAVAAAAAAASLSTLTTRNHFWRVSLFSLTCAPTCVCLCVCVARHCSSPFVSASSPFSWRAHYYYYMFERNA